VGLRVGVAVVFGSGGGVEVGVVGVVGAGLGAVGVGVDVGSGGSVGSVGSPLVVSGPAALTVALPTSPSGVRTSNVAESGPALVNVWRTDRPVALAPSEKYHEYVVP
jgi:hypothetical protein